MANIRSLNDLNTSINNVPFPQAPRASNFKGNSNPNVNVNDDQNIFMIFNNDGNNESPYPPIHKILAPNFKQNTFTFYISVLQIIVFVIELIVGAIIGDGAFVADNEMGGPSSYTLKIMGANYLPNIKKGQIYRYFTPIILHSGILHIFTNLVSQTMICYTCEKYWGFRLIMFIYLITGFGGSILSCVATPCIESVGASGALLGIVGAYISWILLNWNNSQVISQPCPQLCSMLWWMVIIFMIGLNVKGIDNFAHLGGLISGLLVGFLCHESQYPLDWIRKHMNILKISSMLITCAYFLGFLIENLFVQLNC